MNMKEKAAAFDRIQQQRKRYYETHKDEILAKKKEWIKNNPEKMRQYRENFYLRQAERIRKRRDRDAKN